MDGDGDFAPDVPTEPVAPEYAPPPQHVIDRMERVGEVLMILSGGDSEHTTPKTVRVKPPPQDDGEK